MVNRTLPADWEWTTVGEAGKTITGTTPPKSDVKNYGDFIPFIKPPELNDGSLWKSEDNLSEEGARLARVVPEKAVLVSCIGNLGKTGIAKRPVAFNQQINAIVFPENVLPEFGFYYFQSTEFRKQLEDIASATTISIVNKSKFNSLSFPLAPLSEQGRIVSRIEELLSDLDAGVAALERTQTGLQRYKASVLKAAVEGKFEHRNDELGSTPTLLPEGWRWATIRELTSKMQYGTSEKADLDDAGIPVLRMGNIQEGEIDFSNLKYLPENTKGLKDLILENGDLLFNRTNSAELVGKTAVYQEHHPKATFASYLIRVKFKPDVVPNFVSFFINSVHGRRYISSVVSQQVGQANVNGTKLANMLIPLPPLDEQRRIVAEVERRLSVVGEVESAVEVGLVRAGRLRQSVLRSAFEGRLA